MVVDKKAVQYIAKLARLKLKGEEIGYFAGQLNTIIEYIGQLEEVDVSNVGPTSHVLNLQNVFRRDIVKPSLKAEAVLKNAPAKEGSLFKVPPIIEE